MHSSTLNEQKRVRRGPLAAQNALIARKSLMLQPAAVAPVKRASLPQSSDFGQLLLTVSSGKADLTFTEPADAAIFMRNNPHSVARIGGPVRVFPNCYIFKRGQMEFKNMLDTALDQLSNSGAADRIISKYEPQPNLLYRTACPYRK